MFWVSKTENCIYLKMETVSTKKCSTIPVLICCKDETFLNKNIFCINYNYAIVQNYFYKTEVI